MSRFGGSPIFRDFWDWPHSSSPTFGQQMYDQHFGLGLRDEELNWPYGSSSLHGRYYLRPRHRFFDRNNSSGINVVRSDPSTYKVHMDVNQFGPEEITVKTLDNTVVVHAKHEERRDEHGFVSREFQRKYVLPDNVDPDTVVSYLSRDGVLTIEAPRRVEEAKSPNERLVPIVRKDDAPEITETVDELP